MSSLASARRSPGASLLSASRHANRAGGSLSHSRQVLTSFEDAAEAYERAGQFRDAVDAAGLGALLACLRHPGVHVSVRLEALLARVGAAALQPMPVRTAPTGHVLHVATETYPVGGHTRMIWRWIDRDPSHTHDLVTTAQRGEIPDGLIGAVRASGGEVRKFALGAPALERGQALRDMAAGADIIVVHAHPMDPIPTLAFANAANRPPIVLFNHADHMFWVGASIADVLHSIRPLGQTIGAARRIAPERCIVTTAPVAGVDGNGLAAVRDRDADRAMLLEQFDWPADSILLFSAGGGDKYLGTEGLTLLDLVDPVLRATPRARLVVAGPPESEAWRAARKRHAGRVVALGHVPGLSPLFSAADVYLESQPFGGPGSSSEAAAFGLPVLTHAASEAEAAHHCTDARYGASLAVGPREYRRMLAGLIADPEQRAELGARARASIEAADAAWEGGVELVYRRAAELGPASVETLGPPVPQDEELDLIVDECQRSTHPGVDRAKVKTLLANIALGARCPALRDVWDGMETMGSSPPRRIPAAVSVPGSEPDALRAVIAEFLRLHEVGVAARFAIGLRPDQAVAAIPVLEQALEGVEALVDVFVDERAEMLVRADYLEVVVPGQPGTGRAAILECPPPFVAAPAAKPPTARPARSRSGSRARRR